MIKQIISNELEQRCGHPVNETEVLMALEYIHECLSDFKSPSLADIQSLLDNFIDENYIRCDICGEYYLYDETSEEFGYRVCNNSVCHQQADEKHQNWLHRDFELGTY